LDVARISGCATCAICTPRVSYPALMPFAYWVTVAQLAAVTAAPCAPRQIGRGVEDKSAARTLNLPLFARDKNLAR
jgi:hypothetical protein